MIYSIKMFQIQGMSPKSQSLTDKTQNYHMISPTVLRYDRKISQVKLFPAPISPRSYASDPYQLFLSSPAKQNQLLRVNSNGLSSNNGQRIRTSRIFKKEEPKAIGINLSPVNPNFRIVNYGPIKLTSAKVEEKLIAKQSTKIYKDVFDKKTKHVSFNNLKMEGDPKSMQRDESQINRYFDPSITQITMSNSQRSTLQVTGQTLSNRMGQKSSLTEEDDKQNFAPNNQILNSKIMKMFEESQCQEYEDQSKEQINLKLIENKTKVEIVRAWSACVLCLFVILVLLLFK